MKFNRPRGREKNVTGPGRTVKKRGEGLGTGPVGGGTGGGRGGGQTRSGRGKRGGGTKLILLLLLLLLGGGGLTSLGGQQTPPASQQVQQSGGSSDWTQFLGGGSVSSGWQGEANTGRLDDSVAEGSRAKYTRLLGGGRDTATIMLYMCGTDLESRNGMGTADLQEMLDARFGSNVNLLIYTGGCKAWKNNTVSSTVNQIWQVKDGRLVSLEEDLESASMTSPRTLAGYIQWCASHYPASRYELILWDHGGGSISGYGYDEKYASSGSMSLADLDSALKTAGVKFDFIGFDACLMATAETALAMTRYADYLIASEETEPGVGWYYTDWLTALGKNSSMPTIEIGKNIVDGFVDTCAQKCRGQLTTLSVVDLAELEHTLPQALADFSNAAAELIRDQQYQTVSNARNGAREFAQSSQIDQVDLVHLAQNLNIREGQALTGAILGAVKYNRTSSNMTNAYGLSIYFPYRKTSTVDRAVSTFEQIGMDEAYTRCIRQFADVAAGGQVISGSASIPVPALMGTLGGGENISAEDVAAILSMLFDGRSLDMTDPAAYLAEHRFASEALTWSEGEDGVPVLSLDEERWSLVQNLDLNLFYDDGEGYIDLGLDNTYDFDEAGRLLGTGGDTWLAIEGQPVAYYHTLTVDDGENYTITGRVPVLHNGVRAELILVFDNEQPYGFAAGIQPVYHDGETETIAKSLSGLAPGDTLEFLCDYYSYNGDYQDSYLLGDPLTVPEEGLTISDVPLEGSTRTVYRFTDIYNQPYWTPPVP